MITIRPAVATDLALILQFIRDLATYENLLPEVEATEERLRATLFPGEGRPGAECLLAFWDDQPAGFAVFFHNYSTFLAKPGLYLEDLFVEPGRRGHGIGRALLLHCARLANARGCGRMELVRPRLERARARLLSQTGRRGTDGLAHLPSRRPGSDEAFLTSPPVSAPRQEGRPVQSLVRSFADVREAQRASRPRRTRG